MKWAEIAFFRPFYISFSHPKSSPISIYSFFPFTFHTHCVSMIYIDFILHVAFTLLSHLILPLANGAGGCSARRDIDENAFISQSNVVGVYGEGFDKLKVKKKNIRFENSLHRFHQSITICISISPRETSGFTEGSPILSVKLGEPW